MSNIFPDLDINLFVCFYHLACLAWVLDMAVMLRL